MTHECKAVNVIHKGNLEGGKETFQLTELYQLGISMEKKQKNLDSSPHITLKN